jgi:hypothetical protein
MPISYRFLAVKLSGGNEYFLHGFRPSVRVMRTLSSSIHLSAFIQSSRSFLLPFEKPESLSSVANSSISINVTSEPNSEYTRELQPDAGAGNKKVWAFRSV